MSFSLFLSLIIVIQLSVLGVELKDATLLVVHKEELHSRENDGQTIILPDDPNHNPNPATE